jgi:hypothetical protein
MVSHIKKRGLKKSTPRELVRVHYVDVFCNEGPFHNEPLRLEIAVGTGFPPYFKVAQPNLETNPITIRQGTYRQSAFGAGNLYYWAGWD